MNRKTVLLLFTEVFKSTGGIPVFNQNLIKAICNCHNGNKIVLSINDTIKDKKTPYRFSGYGGNRAKFVLTSIYSALRERPGLIICGHINISPLCFLIKKLTGSPYVTITHGIDAWNIEDWKKKKGLSGSELIISVSNYTKSKIKEQFEFEEERFFILPNTVDGDRFKPSCKPEYLLERYGVFDSKIILTICRLDKSEKYKGYDRVIEAMPEVIKEIPDAKYLIGGKGDDVPRIKGLIEQKGLQNYVKLIGFIPEEELVDHYNLCDVFIMPSKGEGFGIVFLEALACGKPVIAGNKDGSVDALLNGELGFLVNPDNVEEIADAIVKVLKGDVPQRLVDPLYLRNKVLEVYGFDRFKERIKNLLFRIEENELQR